MKFAITGLSAIALAVSPLHLAPANTDGLSAQDSAKPALVDPLQVPLETTNPNLNESELRVVEAVKRAAELGPGQAATFKDAQGNDIEVRRNNDGSLTVVNQTSNRLVASRVVVASSSGGEQIIFVDRQNNGNFDTGYALRSDGSVSSPITGAALSGMVSRAGLPSGGGGVPVVTPLPPIPPAPSVRALLFPDLNTDDGLQEIINTTISESNSDPVSPT